MEKYLDQIIQLVGVHGFFAMLATIVTVRFIGIGWYLEKRGMIVSMAASGAVLGALSVYYFTDLTGFKNLSGGSFMAVFGTPMLYHLLKFLTSLAYEKTKYKTFAAIYFFLTPKPIKVVRKEGNGKKVCYEPPHSELTQMLDWARIDKKIRPHVEEIDEHEEVTRVMTEEEKAEITGPRE